MSIPQQNNTEQLSNGVKTKKNLLEKAFLRLTFMVNAVSYVRY